jgi:hypothetical protein
MLKRYKNWQANIKQTNGKWKRISAGKTDLEEAKQEALRKEIKWELLEKRGLPITDQKSFRTVADKYVKKLEQGKKEGTLNPSKLSYISIIQNYLVPFFGAKSINNIDVAEVMMFDEWRDKKMGKVPSKGTVNKHNVVLRAVFDYGIQHKWCKQINVPKRRCPINAFVKRLKRLYFSPVRA